MFKHRMGRRLRVVAAGAIALAAPLGLFAGPAAHAATGTIATGGNTGGSASTLVLYDSSGTYGRLGELYAMTTANLASHFGTWTAEPVTAYQSGQIAKFTATIYLGSTYDEVNQAPAAFITDVTSTTKPVIWAGDNIWNLANRMSGGSSAFTTKYGWDATNSYFTGGVTSVTYKGQSLNRTIPAGADGGVIKPYIVNASKVTTLATAVTSTGSFPWAVRSSNLTYIGEIPWMYVNETNRILAFEDMLFDALAPSTATRHRALLRLEDISCDSDPTDLNGDEKYLASAGIPYGIAVIPHFKDPTGYENGDGVPVDIALNKCPTVLKAVKNMLNNGAVLVDHGDTHQYSDRPNPYTTNPDINIANPYDGVSADDFEFFLSHIDANNNVIYDGPVPTDSASWAQGRINDALNIFSKSGLTPKIWEFPHYAASAVDYQTVAKNFGVRWDRGLYYSGLLSGGAIDSSSYIGQFFPYVVTDIYGTKVLPEDMGNYEPEAENNHPPRLVPDLLAASQANLVVRDGFASTFFHPYYPLSVLKQIVAGIQQQGYSFVDPSTL